MKLLNKIKYLLTLSIVNSCGIIKKAKIKQSRIKGNVNISDGVSIYKSNLLGNIKIGRFTSINGPNTDILSLLNPIEIGSFCSIARGVQIQEYNHNTECLSSYTVNYKLFKGNKKDDYNSKGKITIGNDVWIGANVIILSGVNIGDGVVIAAGSVVSRDIPSYKIVGGIPAKIIKDRFSIEFIEMINNDPWYDWSIQKIKKNKELFRVKQ
jgi:acetyltransferase-like isoleucine patch superfamily enzyme